MSRTLIKICGITRGEDALAAARLGADFVGLVLHADSPRTISIDRAREIVRALPATVTPVGLFVDAPAHEVVQTCHELDLTHVQLHGEEEVNYARSLHPLTVWKMIRTDEHLPDRLHAWKTSRVAAVLLETAHTGMRGGSGRQNDWSAIAKLRDATEDFPFIAAGGLNPENVTGVVQMLRPWAVDVSSGVEGQVRGIKSEQKIAFFIRAVRAADASG